jgi:hypothetical protein
MKKKRNKFIARFSSVAGTSNVPCFPSGQRFKKMKELSANIALFDKLSSFLFTLYS